MDFSICALIKLIKHQTYSKADYVGQEMYAHQNICENVKFMESISAIKRNQRVGWGRGLMPDVICCF